MKQVSQATAPMTHSRCEITGHRTLPRRWILEIPLPQLWVLHTVQLQTITAGPVEQTLLAAQVFAVVSTDDESVMKGAARMEKLANLKSYCENFLTI